LIILTTHSMEEADLLGALLLGAAAGTKPALGK
jgi:hypothetical protein